MSFEILPTEENVIFQEWAYYYWLSQTEKYDSVIHSAMSSIERIAKKQYPYP